MIIRVGLSLWQVIPDIEINSCPSISQFKFKIDYTHKFEQSDQVFMSFISWHSYPSPTHNFSSASDTYNEKMMRHCAFRPFFLLISNWRKLCHKSPGYLQVGDDDFGRELEDEELGRVSSEEPGHVLVLGPAGVGLVDGNRELREGEQQLGTLHEHQRESKRVEFMIKYLCFDVQNSSIICPWSFLVVGVVGVSIREFLFDLVL